MLGLPSIFIAELFAIKVLNIIRPTLRYVLVCSDSMNALQVISDVYSRHPVVYEIHCLISQMNRCNTNVSFCWIPSHIGISGNECPGNVAKEACFRSPLTNCIVSNDLVCTLKRVVHDE